MLSRVLGSSNKLWLLALPLAALLLAAIVLWLATAPADRPPQVPRTRWAVPTPALVSPTTTGMANIAGNPQAFMLTLADLPPGYQPDVEGTGPDSNEALAGARERIPGALATLQAQGRLAGYTAIYSGPLSVLAEPVIGSKASLFRNPEGASAYLHDVVTNVWGSENYRPTPVPVPRIGDEALGFTTSTRGKFTATLTTDIVWFRTRNVVASVWLTNLADDASLDDAVAYARLVESRILAVAR